MAPRLAEARPNHAPAAGARDGAATRRVETLPGSLQRAAELSADGAVLGVRLLDRREREEWVPWHELWREARLLATALRSRGLEPGERVGLVFPTGRAFLQCFFAVLCAGAVPAPLYPPVRLPRLEEYQERTARMLSSIDAALVLCDRQVLRILGPTILRAAPRLGALTPEDVPLSPFSPLSQGEGSTELPVGAPDELALVQFSSGTTVDPKPVALTHRALLAQVRILNSFWPDDERVRHSGVSWLPLYHDMGLVGCILPAVERPAVLTLIPPEVFVARPAVWLRALSRYRATVSPAPNFAYGLCVDKIRDEELAGCDLSSWRIALNGAEAVAPAVLRAFAQRFAAWGFRREALTPVYGLSEAALAVTFSAIERPFRTSRFDRGRLGRDGLAVAAEDEEDGVELAALGRPVPDFSLEVRTENGSSLPENHLGRVWVRGPSLMRGYLGRDDLNERVLRDGWLDTGDLGFLHQDELYLFGRAKDVLILRGQNHSPEPLEHAVSALPDVRSGCVVAASDVVEGAGSERLYLFVERRRGAPSTAAELAGEVRRVVLESFGLDAMVVVVAPGTLPRTTSGKLRRAETVRLYGAGELEPPPSMGPLRLLRALVRSHVALRRAGEERRRR